MNKGCIGRVRVLLLIVALIFSSVECTELISVNARTRTENKSTTYYDKATGNEWSNQIGRIKYQNDTILYNKDIKRFTYMSFMGVHLKEHEERYRKLLKNIEDGIVFSRDDERIWQCSNCGHIVVGKKAPD